MSGLRYRSSVSCLRPHSSVAEAVGLEPGWSRSETALLGFVVLWSEFGDRSLNEWQTGSPKPSATTRRGRKSPIVPESALASLKLHELCFCDKNEDDGGKHLPFIEYLLGAKRSGERPTCLILPLVEPCAVSTVVPIL